MRRRDFIAVLAGGLAASPRPIRAQTAAVPLIGYLSSRSAASEAPIREPLLGALAGAGLVAGRDFNTEYRFAEGHNSRLAELANELIRLPVTLLVTTDRPAALAARAATTTIPIVFASGVDPVRVGLVASMTKPGGNATGVSLFTAELGPKRLGLLREIMPAPGLIAFVVNPRISSTPFQVKEMQAAADAIAQPLTVVNVGTEAEIDEAFKAMPRNGVRAILYGASPFFQVMMNRLVALAAQTAIPAGYEWREFVTAGGLMSYSTNRTEVGRQIGAYAAQILKGAKPSDLPVVQSSSFELVINAKTARALGLTIPPTLLARADEVIE